MAYSGSFHLHSESPDVIPEHDPVQERPEAAASTSGRTGRRQRPSFDLGSLFQKTEAAGWESDDLLLALVLYLMYRESGDQDLLIMLAVMLLT